MESWKAQRNAYKKSYRVLHGRAEVEGNAEKETRGKTGVEHEQVDSTKCRSLWDVR